METFIPWSMLQRSKSVLRDFSQYSYEVGVIFVKELRGTSRRGGVSDQKQVSRRDELWIRAGDAHVCGGLASCTKMP